MKTENTKWKEDGLRNLKVKIHHLSKISKKERTWSKDIDINTSTVQCTWSSQQYERVTIEKRWLTIPNIAKVTLKESGSFDKMMLGGGKRKFVEKNWYEKALGIWDSRKIYAQTL